jgi:hypothetical protein
MVRFVVLAALLVACGGSRSHTPAWPKASAHDSDGGESLAPRVAGSVAAIEQADEIKPDDKPVVKPDAPAETSVGIKPVVPATTKPDDVITTEDIIIEIDD